MTGTSLLTPLGDELLDRDQLYGGDAEGMEVIDDCRAGQPCIGPSEFLRYLGMSGREPLDV